MRVFSRSEAAKLIAARLRPDAGSNALVLAASRNAVPFACALAGELRAEVDIALTQVLRSASPSSRPIAAVSETGQVFWNESDPVAGISDEELARAIVAGLNALLERRGLYTHERPPADPAGRTTIVARYGVASGSSMVAALQSARALWPGRLIAAVASATPGALRRIRRQADDVVCLEMVDSYAQVARSLGGGFRVTEEHAAELIHEASQARA